MTAHHKSPHDDGQAEIPIDASGPISQFGAGINAASNRIRAS
jgi:hypothetical protein